MAEGTIQPDVKLGEVFGVVHTETLDHLLNVDTQNFIKGFIFTGDARATVVFCTSL